MTKRYPLGSALGGGDSSDAGDFQRVALGRFAVADLLERSTAKAHKSIRGRFAHSRSLGTDVDHGYFRSFAEMGKTFHSSPRRGRTMAISPASQFSFSGETITNAFDSAMVTTSRARCYGKAETSGSPRTV